MDGLATGVAVVVTVTVGVAGMAAVSRRLYELLAFGLLVVAAVLALRVLAAIFRSDSA